MLGKLLSKIIPTIDGLIEKIPPHIRDIIQKASIAFGALLALIAIIMGVNRGLTSAKPAGYQLAGNSRDLFYLQEMREEYAKKRKLVEDIEADPMDFPSRQKQNDSAPYHTMGRDRLDHLAGEKDEMLKHNDPMRPQEKAPGYLGDSFTLQRLTPDKKTLEDDEPLLKKEKIGSQKPPENRASKDIFVEELQKTKQATPPLPAMSAPQTKQPKESKKLDFMD